MIVLGADTHKRTHALAAVDAGERRRRARSARSPLTSPGICRRCGGRASSTTSACGRSRTAGTSRAGSRPALVAAGERVVRVAPQLMGQSPPRRAPPGKSDQIDALAVARAVLREGVERFPAAFLDERAMEIRLLADHRGDLVAERTRIENRLRWHLVDLCPELEAQVPVRSLDHPVWLDRITRKLQRLPSQPTRGCGSPVSS